MLSNYYNIKYKYIIMFNKRKFFFYFNIIFNILITLILTVFIPYEIKF